MAIEEIYEEELVEEPVSGLEANIDSLNLLEDVPNIDEVATTLQDELQEAQASMKDWARKYKRALDLASLNPEAKEKTFPFQGASTAMMPFILEAAFDFHARSVGDLVYSDQLVSAKIHGGNTDIPEPPPNAPPELVQEFSVLALEIQKANDAIVRRGERVQEYMNYQLTYLIPKWRTIQDKLLLMLPIVGTIFKKNYYDSDIKQQRSEMVTPDRLIFNHKFDDFSEARYTFEPMELNKNEVVSNIRGMDWDIPENELDDDTYEFYECQVWIDLDGDGLEEPYIAIWWSDRSKIVSVRANYDEDCITYNDKDEVVNVEPLDHYIQYTFIPDPAGGCMGLGWGILLGDMFEAINTNVRQLIDAGTLQNVSANSGLIDTGVASPRGNRIQSGPIEVQMGELTKIQSPAGRSLRESVVQFPFAGPSAQLFQLMQALVDSARQLTVASYSAEGHAGEAAELYLARLQQALKQPNSIVMRVYHCMAAEFNHIAKLNYRHYDQELYTKVLDTRASMEADFNYDDCDVAPVANPAQGSDIERIAKAQAVYKMSFENPGINKYEASYRLLDAMNVPDIDTVLPEPDPNYRDPMEVMMMQQKAAEMELYNRELLTKEKRLALEEIELGIKYETALADLDKTESETTKNYAQSVEIMAKTQREQALAAMDRIKVLEERFLTAEGGAINGSRETEISTNNTGRTPDLAVIESDESLSAIAGIPNQPIEGSSL